MLIRSQNGRVLVNLENGSIVENGTRIFFQNIVNGPTYELGKYIGSSSSDHSRTQKVINEILSNKKMGIDTYQMPQENEL